MHGHVGGNSAAACSLGEACTGGHLLVVGEFRSPPEPHAALLDSDPTVAGAHLYEGRKLIDLHWKLNFLADFDVAHGHPLQFVHYSIGHGKVTPAASAHGFQVDAGKPRRQEHRE